MTETSSLRATLALALALAFLPAASAIAADDGSDNASSEAAGASAAGNEQEPVTDAELQKFAAAYGELQTVRAEYGQKMQQADDKAAQKALRKEGQQAMVSAIRDEGLKIAEYRRIGQELNSNKGLQARLRSLMQEQQQDGGAGESDSS